MQYFSVLTRVRPRLSHLRFCSSKVRNVGIMAHIDAGKTTTTERMLLYSGFMPMPGEVHHGDTVMDYMDQERERGITINAAAITFPWKKHQINLIDTPGHVDFTIEVERALRVLDGGIVILDGSAGVEAQTLTVWRQANKNRVPRIAFVNKMDKHNADFNSSIESIQKKLNTVPIPIQKPVGVGKGFCGLLDLVRLNALLWNDKNSNQGRNFQTISLQDASIDDPKIQKMKEECFEGRLKMIETLSEFDDGLADMMLTDESGDYSSISPEIIDEAIKRVVLKSEAIVTLCGSAYRNIGVQPLMDAVIAYLPSPSEIQHEFLSHYSSKDFCAMAFKIVHHPQKGTLTFLRIYSGRVKEGDSIYNVNSRQSEKIAKLYIAFADDFRPINSASAGSIVAAVGLRETITGNTLVHSKSFADRLDTSAALPGVEIPDPVFYCSIEPPSMSKQRQLDQALANLTKEDPSLRISQDSESGQTILSGMGELHIEVIRERIRAEYKVEADLGRLMVAYKEIPTIEATSEFHFDRRVADKHHIVNVTLSVTPSKNITSLPPTWKISNDATTSSPLKPWVLKAIEKGFDNAFNLGPILGYSVVSCVFTVKQISIERGTSETMISSAIVGAVQNVLKSAHVCLLEPMMKLCIHAEPEAVSKITQDLFHKRGQIESTSEDQNHLTELVAFAPLSELRGYSSHLRTITSGRAFLGMEFSHYQLMGDADQRRAIEDVTGFKFLK